MAQTVCLVVLLALGILAAPLTSEAQRPVKVPVIGMLTPAPSIALLTGGLISFPTWQPRWSSARWTSL